MSSAPRTTAVGLAVAFALASFLAGPAGARELAAAPDDRPVDWARLEAAWRHSADLDARLATLAAHRTEQAPLSPAQARTRLAAWTGDLAARRALVDLDPRHGDLLRARLELIEASGDGTPAAPWRVTTAQDAVAVLRLQGRTVAGGYYGMPTAMRLTLILLARTDDGPAREFAFDLSDTYLAWRDSGIRRLGVTPIGSRDLVEVLRAADDSFAHVAMGIVTATEGGTEAEFDAASQLLRAASQGNLVGHYTLGDLYMRLVHRQGRAANRLQARARASALAHYRAAARGGAAYGDYKLGLLALDDGDPARAMVHLERAHAGGDRAASRRLALRLRSSTTDDDRARARVILGALAEGGDQDATYDLAAWVLEDEQRHDAALLAALQEQAEAGHALSMALLGDLHARGLHVARDHDQARRLWAGAALTSTDPRVVEGIARALLLNGADGLRDPDAAARAMTRIMRSERARDCGDCYATWALALDATGDRSAARRVLREGLAETRGSDDQAALQRLQSRLASTATAQL